MGSRRPFQPILTQEEFDRAVAERLGRQCATHRAELSAFRTQVEGTTTALADQVSALGGRLLDAEARAIAADLGYIRPASAVVASAVLDDLTVAPDGTVDTATIRERLTTFRSTHPYFTRTEEHHAS